MPYKTLIFICAYLLGSSISDAHKVKDLKSLKRQEQLSPGAPTGGDPRILAVSEKGKIKKEHLERLLNAMVKYLPSPQYIKTN